MIQEIEAKQNFKEIKRIYSSPVLKEIGRVKCKTKGTSTDKEPDSGSLNPTETHS